MNLLNEASLKIIFSSNLKDLMAKHGTNENLLSEGTEISQSAINRIKNGTVVPSLHQAVKIAEYFKININELLVVTENNHTLQQEYIPVINSKEFVKSGNRAIEGFFPAENNIIDGVAFKYDNSFSCNILKKDSIVITQKIENIHSIPNGTTILFLQNQTYKIGNYSQGVIRPIDNLMEVIEARKSSIVGKVIKLETKYIKDKTLIEKIIENIGINRLNWLIDKNIGYISA